MSVYSEERREGERTHVHATSIEHAKSLVLARENVATVTYVRHCGEESGCYVVNYTLDLGLSAAERIAEHRGERIT